MQKKWPPAGKVYFANMELARMEQVVETLGGWVGFWDVWEMKMRGGTMGRVNVGET